MHVARRGHPVSFQWAKWCLPVRWELPARDPAREKSPEEDDGARDVDEEPARGLDDPCAGLEDGGLEPLVSTSPTWHLAEGTARANLGITLTWKQDSTMPSTR